MLFLAIYLKGATFIWFESFLIDHLRLKDKAKNKTIKIFSKFLAFERELQLVFRTINEERTAARDISILK